MARETRWALTEASLFFEGKGKVQETLRRITARLDELGIPYAVSGGLALFVHGYRRFTEDVDILVTREGLKAIHEKLEGLGYVAPFRGSKNLRDTDSGVKVDFLVKGQFPGDGKPKPVAFPDPGSVSMEKEGIKYLGLPALVELKLASGMTGGSDREKDIVDIIELVKVLDLPKELETRLSPYVREKYREIWDSLHASPKRFVTIWRNKFLTVEASNLDQMADALRRAADMLAAMRADGVTLDPAGGTADDYAILVTTDPAVARKYDMHDESEFMDDESGGNETPSA